MMFHDYRNTLVHYEIYDCISTLLICSQVSDLLSDLGGQAGLWLGVSVIAFFEFIELFFDVICVAVGRRKNKLNSVETVEKT